MRTALVLTGILLVSMFIITGCTNPDEIINLSNMPQVMTMMAASLQTAQLTSTPYLLDTGLVSRSISFENPTGAPGERRKSGERYRSGQKRRSGA